MLAGGENRLVNWHSPWLAGGHTDGRNTQMSETSRVLDTAWHLFNSIDVKGNYSATSNNTKLVHWLLIGGLLHLVHYSAAVTSHCTNTTYMTCQLALYMVVYANFYVLYTASRHT